MKKCDQSDQKRSEREHHARREDRKVLKNYEVTREKAEVRGGESLVCMLLCRSRR